MIRLYNFSKKRVPAGFTRQYRAVMILTAILFLLSSGCTIPNPQPAEDLQTEKEGADQLALDRGMEAFQAGDYQRAGKIFEETSLSNNPQVSRQALYGLSCTRLVLADTPKQYAAALAQWQSWSRLASLKYHTEDPRLLTPLLGRLTPPVSKKSKPLEEPEPGTVKPNTVSLKRYRACEGKIQDLENRIEGLESQKKLLRYYVDYTARLENEIWSLKHKINSLEAIDKKILEKKKEISSP